MVSENPSQDCLDMTNIHELGNRNQGDFVPEDITDLLNKGYTTSFGESREINGQKKYRYTFTTYIQGKQIDVSYGNSYIHAFKDMIHNDKDFMLYFLATKNQSLVFEEEAGDVQNMINIYKSERVVKKLLSMYTKHSLWKKGRLVGAHLDDDGEYSLDDDILKLKGKLSEMRLEKGVSNDEVIKQFENLTAIGLEMQLVNSGIQDFIEEAIRVEGDSFEKKREAYLEEQKKLGEKELCDEVSQELVELNEGIKSTGIYEVKNNPDKTQELLDFIKGNNFTKSESGGGSANDQEPSLGPNTFLSPNKKLKLYFHLDSGNNGLVLSFNRVDITDLTTNTTDLINMPNFSQAINQINGVFLK